MGRRSVRRAHVDPLGHVPSSTKTGSGTGKRSVPLAGVGGVSAERPGTSLVFHTSVCLVRSKASGVFWKLLRHTTKRAAKGAP